MNREQLEEMIDERNAFRSLNKEYVYESRKVKEKEKPFKDVYTKSTFFAATY